MRRLKDLGIEAEEVRLTGGGARSPVWRQVIADIFGVNVVAMKEDEGAALGAAIQAAWCCDNEAGKDTAIADIVGFVVEMDESTRCPPNPNRHAFYLQLQELQDELSGALRRIFCRHRNLVSGAG